MAPDPVRKVRPLPFHDVPDDHEMYAIMSSSVLLIILSILLISRNITSFTPSRFVSGALMQKSSTSLNYSVRVINNKKGTDDTFESAGTEPLLDTAEAKGITNIPYSCRAGSCSACIGKIVSGEVDQSTQIFLDEDKEDAGWILTCVAVPMSDVEVVVDNEEEFYDEVRAAGDTL